MASMQNILFLDVETVSQFAGFEELDPHGKKHWQQKINYFAKKDDHPWTEEDFARSYSDKAAIYAEFGKVIVISAGILNQSDNQQPVLRIKSFYGHDEKTVLQQFSTVLEKNLHDPNQHII